MISSLLMEFISILIDLFSEYKMGSIRSWFFEATDEEERNIAKLLSFLLAN